MLYFLIADYLVNSKMIMQEQDKALDSITGTVATLTEQAGLMGREIGEHMECVFSILLFLLRRLTTYANIHSS